MGRTANLLFGNYRYRYKLPAASDTVLGGVKVGNTLEIDESYILNVKESLTEDWQEWTFEDVVAGTAKDYVIDLKASVGYIITSIVLQTDNGTLTGVSLKINGTAVTGISAVTVTTTISETSATAANTVTAGDLVTFHITTGYTGTPTLIHGKINYTRA